MSDRTDAHIHLFAGGYQGSFAGRPGVRFEEDALYASLAADHGVRQALVVGYEGQAWAQGNNAYIAGLAKKHAWIRPLAHVDVRSLTMEGVYKILGSRFSGLSLYVFSEANLEALGEISSDVWSLLVRQRGLVSLNTSCRHLRAWLPILERDPELRLLVSHMALPPRVAQPPSAGEARAALADLTDLARYPGPHVKLSGFYAISEPGFAYPHRAAWPYVEVLVEAFGAGRLLWGSDFTPCLDNLSFPQTFGLFAEMPFLRREDREAIEGRNLLRLLGEVRPQG